MGVPPSGLGPQRDVYYPYLQLPNAALVVAARSAGSRSAAAAALRAAVRRLDPTLPVYDVALLDERLARQEGGSRALGGARRGYAAAALCLAAVGLSGVLARSVEQRTREIGIRRALGAARGDIVGMVLREGLVPTIAGMGAGIAASVAASHAIANLLFGVAPRDPAVFATISVLILLVAAAASAVPALRASRVDPMIAMRQE